MSSFLYYIPKKSGISEADLKLVGLDMLSSYSQVGCFAGPDGGSQGVLVCEDGPFAPKINYDKKTQTWKKCYGGKYWIGYEKDNRPGPLELAKTIQVDGYPNFLSDKNEWVLPSAKALPSYLGIDEDGNRQKRLKPEYKNLSELGEKVFKAYKYEISKEEITEEIRLTAEESYEIAIECLQVNYRIGPYEVDALELMTPSDLKLICSALIDFPMIVSEKKNEDVDSTSKD